MDVRKYFQNINKDILYKILSKKILDINLLWLLKEIILLMSIQKCTIFQIY